jgi:mono/diheme cytochrome c family protein
MKKALRYLLILLGVVLIGVGGFAAFVAMRGVPSYKAEKINLEVEATPARIEKGQKLASMLCSGCHMDRNSGKLSGRLMDDVPQFGSIYSKNITQHPEYGIGKWTDGEIAYLLRTGLKPDGTYLPIMAKLAHVSDEDIYSIIAFLRSNHPWVSPDSTMHPQSQYSFLAKALTNLGMFKPSEYPKHTVPGPDTTNQVAWGRYIAVNQLECFSCHSADFTKNNYEEPEKSAGFFGGGNKFEMPDGSVMYSLNLTMDEETGLGTWSEEEFVTALKTGKVPHGQPALRQPMAPYTGLSDSEAQAIYAYLKTVPKIKNKVERVVK